MNIRHLPSLVLALVLAGPTLTALAQPAAPPPAAGASSPPATLPGPRLLSPEEKRDAASPADDVRPEGTVTPQIVVPLNQPATTPLKVDKLSAPAGKAATPGGVDDAAARCGAQTDKQSRARCRDQIKQDTAKR